MRGLSHSSDLRKRLHQVNSFSEVEGIFGDYLAAGLQYSETVAPAEVVADAESDAAEFAAIADE